MKVLKELGGERFGSRRGGAGLLALAVALGACAVDGDNVAELEDTETVTSRLDWGGGLVWPTSLRPLVVCFDLGISNVDPNYAANAKRVREIAESTWGE